MNPLNLNDKIVIALLVHGHCQAGFSNRDNGSRLLKDGWRIQDFVTHKSDGVVEMKGDNISYTVDSFNLSCVLNFYGKKINIYALKHELDLANKIADTIKIQCELADIEYPNETNLSYVFDTQEYERVS
jgi:hypothetical protein